MAIAQEPDGSVEDPAYSSPFMEADREQLLNRGGHFVDLVDCAEDARAQTHAVGSLGAREVLSALRGLEYTRRLVETMTADLMAAYARVGDSAAHGYRTQSAMLAAEFRLTPGEVKRRMGLRDHLTERVAESGEQLGPVRPVIAEEFQAGRVSADEARALCDAVDSLPPTIGAVHGDRVEKTLVELAPTVRLKDLPALCNRIVQHVDPDGSLPVFEPEPAKYTVTLAQQRNGDWRLRGLLSGQTGTTLHALLYGRMTDADVDVPVTVRPHQSCATAPTAAEQVSTAAEQVSTAAEQVSTAAEQASTAAEQASGSAVTNTSGVSTTPAPETGVDGTGGVGDSHRSEDDYTAASSAGDERLPQVPQEAVWESTRIRVHRHGTVEINDRVWTLDEHDPRFVCGPDGWPRALPDRIQDAVEALLEQARTAADGQADTVLWAKIPGREQAGPLAGSSGGPPEGSGSSCPSGAGVAGEDRDHGAPDSGAPDSGAPDSGLPDSGVPDSGDTDVGEDP